MLRVSLVLLTAGPLAAADPPGRAAVADYFLDAGKRLAENSIAGPVAKESWEKQRPALREQFLDMMGLWPLPGAPT